MRRKRKRRKKIKIKLPNPPIPPNKKIPSQDKHQFLYYPHLKRIMPMSEDETVNGPKIAAQILARMSPAHQAKLMERINAKDAKIAGEIKKNIITYADIADLTSQGVQVLIKHVEHRDLVVSLKTASEKVKKALMENMSGRKKQVVDEDFAALPPTKLSEIEEAQKRIAVKMDELITAGSIRSL